MKFILSHPSGNTNVRAIASGLLNHKVLFRFYTSIASFPQNIWYRVGKIPSMSALNRRTYDLGLKPYTYLFPRGEIGRILSSKLRLKSLLVHETGRFSTDQNYHAFDRKVASTLKQAKSAGVTGVYAYEDGALETFKRAKELDLKCIYDLPIAYWETSRALMLNEAARLPQWAGTLGGGISDSDAKLKRKKEELELADVIVCASSFVLNSLPEWTRSKIKILSPFGSPESDSISEMNAQVPSDNPQRKLRVLFAGSMGQRKGLGDLFNAMKLLGTEELELVVMGSLLEPLVFYKNEYPHFIYEPVRSHTEVLALMRSCDVFCLPSIVEGRALVMQEAMSQGLPLIITENTGGEDLIVEGVTGFLVPICSPESIADRLIWFLNNREKIKEMGVNAISHAAGYTWKNYSDKIIKELGKL